MARLLKTLLNLQDCTISLANIKDYFHTNNLGASVSGYVIMRPFNSQLCCMEAKTMERTSNQPALPDSLTSDLGVIVQPGFSKNAAISSLERRRSVIGR
jgi:hypothetical protein